MAARKPKAPATLREVRIWAAEKDLFHGKRGRLPKDLVAQFEKETKRAVGITQPAAER